MRKDKKSRWFSCVGIPIGSVDGTWAGICPLVLKLRGSPSPHSQAQLGNALHETPRRHPVPRGRCPLGSPLQANLRFANARSNAVPRNDGKDEFSPRLIPYHSPQPRNETSAL